MLALRSRSHWTAFSRHSKAIKTRRKALFLGADVFRSTEQSLLGGDHHSLGMPFVACKPSNSVDKNFIVLRYAG